MVLTHDLFIDDLTETFFSHDRLIYLYQDYGTDSYTHAAFSIASQSIMSLVISLRPYKEITNTNFTFQTCPIFH